MRERRTRKDMVLLVGIGIFLISPGELRQADKGDAVATARVQDNKAVNAAPTINMTRTGRTD